MKTSITIPPEVLSRIEAGRPETSRMITNLRAYPSRAMQLEKAIADQVLRGEVLFLSPLEMFKLSKCCVGASY